MFISVVASLFPFVASFAPFVASFFSVVVFFASVEDLFVSTDATFSSTSFFCFFSSFFIGRLTVKQEPLPSSDVTVMVPPSICTTSRVIDRPSPTPSLPCPLGRRVKASKMRWQSAWLMPRPVSLTYIIRCCRGEILISTFTPPRSVYFTALPMRLLMICFTRNASLRHRSPQLGVSVPSVMSRPFSAAIGLNSSTQLFANCCGTKLTSCRSAFPLSSK